MKSSCMLFLISALVAGSCLAQNQQSKDEQQKFYRLDFVVKEVGDGKVINSRNYSTTTPTRNPPAQIRTGSKVPRQTGSPTNPYEYIDVGVNIDCNNAREVENQLALSVIVDITSLAPGQTAANGALPLLRHNTWQSEVILPFRKSTVIFSSDDPTSTHKMQVELTATPIK